jgi:hypothetical protein
MYLPPHSQITGKSFTDNLRDKSLSAFCYAAKGEAMASSRAQGSMGAYEATEGGEEE